MAGVQFASLPDSDVFNVIGMLWLTLAPISTVSVNEIIGTMNRAKHVEVKYSTLKDWKDSADGFVTVWLIWNSEPF